MGLAGIVHHSPDELNKFNVDMAEKLLAEKKAF